MKHFAIEPLGLTPEDIERLDAQFEQKLAHEQDFLLAYYTDTRKIVLFAWTQAGQVQSWMMMPCPSRDRLELLQAWYAGEIAADLRKQDSGAEAATIEALDRIRNPFT